MDDLPLEAATLSTYLDSWVERLRREEPDALGVLLTGSYSRGEAGRYSDLDLLVLTHSEPRVLYRALLEDAPGGSLLHVSVESRQLDKWRERCSTPAGWSFYFPAVETARLLWADPVLADELRDPVVIRPSGTVELEDWVELACKVARAASQGDDVAARLFARDFAQHCASVLRPLNPEVVVSTRFDALRAALGFPIAPRGYTDDMLVCLDMGPARTPASGVWAAVERLALGITRLAAGHLGELRGQLEPELPRYLADGTLERYIRQLRPHKP